MPVPDATKVNAPLASVRVEAPPAETATPARGMPFTESVTTPLKVPWACDTKGSRPKPIANFQPPDFVKHIGAPLEWGQSYLGSADFSRLMFTKQRGGYPGRYL